MSSEWAEQPASGAAAGAAGGAGDKYAFPGQALAAQREAMGWSVEQVADQLKMAVRQVIALEAGDYASLPGPAVVRGFVRAYAKVVKLDAAPLVAMIAIDSDSAGDTTPRTVRRDKPASFSEVRFPTNGKRSSLPLGLIGGVVVLVAAVAGAWQFGLIPASLLGAGSTAHAPIAAAAGSQASVTVLPAPVAPASGVETTLVKPGDDLKPLQNPSVPLISVPPPAAQGAGAPASAGVTGATAGATNVAPATTAAATATPAVAPTAAVAGTAAAPATPSGALVLNVREDAWIDVRSASGKKLFSGLVKGGTVKAMDVTGPATLKVGNAAAVSATLRGNALPLPPMAGSTVAKVSLQ